MEKALGLWLRQPADRVWPRLSCCRAPDVGLNIHIASINTIERGVIDGTLHIGVIPAHRNSASLAYARLFRERMPLFCGRGHALFEGIHRGINWEDLKQHAFAGLGYHSPNMELSHRERLVRSATGFDQEAIAALVLSGKFLGFLPDHYAEAFASRGLMRAILPSRFQYECSFALLRRSPQPARAAAMFHECLVECHPPTNGR